jgi:hypothetical protein
VLECREQLVTAMYRATPATEVILID